jgi:UDP-3-O-[3-hydroxymyristoyl] glucosamine N-acyltransferase
VPQLKDIVDRFPQLFTESIGDLTTQITGVNSPDFAQATDLCFLANPKAIEAGLKSKAVAFVISAKAKDAVASQAHGRPLLITGNPEKAMALVISAFFRATPYTNKGITKIHATAVVDPTAKVAASARIGPHAFIGANVTIHEHAYIGPNAVIEDGSTIGEATVIHPNVFIGHSTQIGARCEIHPSAVIGKEGFGYAHDEKFNHTRIPHQGFVVLEDDVHIGACCTIDRGTFGETRIERGVIMDNLVHIAHNNRIGRNSVLTSGFTMAGSSKIGANFVTGGKSVVTGHIEIADNVQLSALSAVAKTVPNAGQYGGHPLQPLQSYLKSQAAIPHLPEMRKLLKKIAIQLGYETEL